MKPARISLLFAIGLPLTLAGCGDRGAPSQPATSVDLAGGWSGTVTSVQDSAGVEAGCRSESIDAVITQVGVSVGGRLLASCTGPLDLSGTIDGNILTGTLVGGSRTLTGGRVSAVVSSSQIDMTVGRSARNEFIPLLSIRLFR